MSPKLMTLLKDFEVLFFKIGKHYIFLFCEKICFTDFYFILQSVESEPILRWGHTCRF